MRILKGNGKKKQVGSVVRVRKRDIEKAPKSFMIKIHGKKKTLNKLSIWQKGSLKQLKDIFHALLSSKGYGEF